MYIQSAANPLGTIDTLFTLLAPFVISAIKACPDS